MFLYILEKIATKDLLIYELAYPNLNKKRKRKEKKKKNQKQEKKRAIDRIPSYRSESNLYDFEDYRNPIACVYILYDIFFFFFVFFELIVFVMCPPCCAHRRIHSPREGGRT